MWGLNRITYLWPGLSRLWWRGELSMLVIAVAFAALLNLLLVDSLLLPGLLSVSWSRVGWMLCLLFWCGGVWHAARHGVAADAIQPVKEQQDLLNRAQAEYLRGCWSDAQALLEQQIRRNPEDIESLLLLSSVFRRTDRIDQSQRKLDLAMRLEGAQKWHLEIQREKTILERERSAPDHATSVGT